MPNTFYQFTQEMQIELHHKPLSVNEAWQGFIEIIAYIYGMANKLKIETLIGKNFNELTLLSESLPHFTKSGHKHRTGIFKCSCGKQKKIQISSVINGITKSCGCLSNSKASKRMSKINHKHGYYGTSEYNSWISMRKRCNNLKHKSFKDYGARGINVCDSWNKSFSSFIKDMGTKPSKEFSLERLDNNKGYNKENCVWASKKDQAKNQRSNVFLSANGETKCLSEWASILGFSFQKLNYRLFLSKKKYSLEKMLENGRY
jgi:hypothetical protein